MTPFGIKDKIGYALGDFGCNLSFSLISSFMYLFYTQYMGLTSKAWAAIIIVVKVWDAINDPIMGGVMDSIKIGNGGKFKPWIKIGSYGLILGGALVFLPIPNASTAVKVAICIITYLFWDVSYTLVNVPYGAFNAAISADTGERAQLSTFRSIGGGLGGLVIMILPVFLFDDADNLLGGRLIWAGAGLGVVAFFSFRLFLKLTTERVEVLRERQKFNYFKTIKGFLTNRPALALSLASFALLVFFMSTSVTNTLIFQIYFKNAKMTALASILSYVPLVISIPFVSYFVKRFGKKLAAGMPLLISVVTSVIMLLIPFDPAKVWSGWVYIAGLSLIQLGGGMFQLICWAMVADCIDYQHIKTGRRDEGSVYAFYSLFRKLAQGVGAAIVPIFMVWVGYQESLGPNQLDGVGEKMKDVSILLVLAGSAIMAFFTLVGYNLGKKQVAEINEKLGKLTTEIDINEALSSRQE